MRIRVVIPSLDEAARLPALLERLRWMPIDEVIVVDGGSTDATPELARGAGAVVRTAPRGRSRQLNRGAEGWDGDALWFLHADAMPPVDAVARIRRALADEACVGGAFLLRTRHDGGRWRLGPLLRIADLRSRVTALPYGDQGLFVRRAAFEAVGGFPDVPILEDLGLSRRLRTRGRLARVPAEVEVSGRRFAARPLYYFAVMNALPVLAGLGVSPERLARWYPDER